MTRLLAKRKRVVNKNLISAATHWTEMCGPRLTARWRSGMQCVGCCHKNWYWWRV